jgi:hypothetical protein
LALRSCNPVWSPVQQCYVRFASWMPDDHL